MTTIRAALAWPDIVAMTPSPRRTELIDAYGRRVEDLRRCGHDADDMDMTVIDAETIRIESVIRFGDTPQVTAMRYAELKAAVSQVRA
jgi:hypothetical protein